MTRDRTYLRMLSDRDLADAAQHSDNDLALVLGERLAYLIDADDELEAAKAIIKELQAEIDALEAEIDAIDDEVA